MKLVNNTKYDTPALRKFFARALRELRKSEGSNPHFRNVTITCNPSRTWITGEGGWHEYRVLLRIPSRVFVIKPEWEARAKTDLTFSKWLRDAKEQTMIRRDTLAFSLAWVFYHELWHNLGYDHRRVYEFCRNVGYDHRPMDDRTFKRLAEWARTYGELPPAQKKRKPANEKVPVRRSETTRTYVTASRFCS